MAKNNALAPSRGGVRIGDLLAAPSLQLTLIAGADGVGRRVSWTHISELEDPGPWLEGDELLFTLGLGIPETAASQVRYLERLIQHRVVCLAIGDRHPPLHPELLASADENRFPILNVPRGVPVQAITRMVAASSQNIAQRRLATHVRIFDTLRDRMDQSLSDVELFRRLEKLTGYEIYLVATAGRPLLTGLPDAPPEVVEQLPSMGNDISLGDSILLGDDNARVVAIPVENRAAGYLVAVEREGLEPAGLAAVGHVATVAAMRLSELYRTRELERHEGAENLASLLSGRFNSADARRQLGSAGLDLDGPLLLAACRTNAHEADVELHHRLLDEGIRHLMLRQRELYLLLPASADVVAALGASDGLRAGVSRELDGNLADLPLARREALWGLQRAEAGGGEVIRFGEDEDSAYWLPADFAALERLIVRVLGPIMEYDLEHKTELLASLATNFRLQRQVQVTADELFIHKHTLAYRLRRIEELTGRRLNEVQVQAQVWLALSALAIVNPDMVENDPRLII